MLALLVSMATSAQSNIALGPFDNPFALLVLRKTSVEAAPNMKDFEKAYRTASKILHPDKVKNHEDERLKSIMSEQFCKAARAKELLIVPAGDQVALQRRNTTIRRYLWTEQELVHKSSASGAVDDNIRVLPGIGLLQGHLLQAFARRDLRRTKKSVQSAKGAAGFTKEKSLAVVQHESLPMFRGRPFEVPHGCTTKQAKRKAK